MNQKKRIAIIFAGGSISTYLNRDSNATFSIETKEDLLSFIPDLEDRYRWSLFSQVSKNKFFLSLSDWEKIYELIQNKYAHFDGFVVAQESDSLLFGASLFSYMFSECRKPIIFTASPFPLGAQSFTGNRPEQNLSYAIDFAASDIGEVCVYDNNILHRAVRVRRNNILNVHSFSSYQADPLGEIIEGTVKLYLHRKHKEKEVRSFPYIFPQDKVLFIRMFPGCSLEVLSASLKYTEIEALVIETLGYGSLSPAQINELTVLSNAGIRIVLLAKNDSAERMFPMDSDNQHIPNSVLLQNTTIWGMYAKAHVALKNTKTVDEFISFMKTPFNGDIVE